MDRFLADEIAEGVRNFDFDSIFRKLISIIYDGYQASANKSDGEEMFDAFLKRREAFLKYVAPRLRKVCCEKRFKSTLATVSR